MDSRAASCRVVGDVLRPTEIGSMEEGADESGEEAPLSASWLLSVRESIAKKYCRTANRTAQRRPEAENTSPPSSALVVLIVWASFLAVAQRRVDASDLDRAAGTI
jgi:hypothetical protein